MSSLREHSKFWYWAGTRAANVIARVFGRMGFRGRQTMPAEGPVMLVCNHLSHLDPPLIGSFFPRHIRFMAKEELYVSVLGWYLRKVCAFPVKRGTADRAAIRHAFDILAEGKVLGMFPEGHRSEDGRLQAGEDGAALIALRSRATIYPMGISGTNRVIRPHKVLPGFGKVVIRFGEPFRLEDLYDQSGREAITEANRRIMASIAALLPPQNLPAPEPAETEAR